MTQPMKLKVTRVGKPVTFKTQKYFQFMPSTGIDVEARKSHDPLDSPTSRRRGDLRRPAVQNPTQHHALIAFVDNLQRTSKDISDTHGRSLGLTHATEQPYLCQYPVRHRMKFIASVKFYDEDARVWVREYENGQRQRSATPRSRSAAPGASASGLAIHRDTYEYVSPIAMPHGSWIAQTPSGRIATLNPADYVSIRTPRIPQPPLQSHYVTIVPSTREPQQPFVGSSADSWLLAAPLTTPTVVQHTPAAHPPHAIEVVYDEHASRRQRSRDREIVEDPRRPGVRVTVRTVRERTELVEDPRRPGHFITLRALRERENRVEDPQRPGRFITRTALRIRQDLVDDPNNPGQQITRSALRQRGDRVEDPLHPGTTISRAALRRRSNLVEDPRRPGTFITRHTLLSRERRQR
ncbi:hypothetical protein Q3G72_009384 [Acer saccharum]|nr:hypothetical protein Q3G72_009384 [Acer saccharum]